MILFNMNLYIRFFESEVLVSSVQEAFDFLQSLPSVDLDEFLMNDIKAFYESNNMYPKRYKVHGRSYFIVIKTTATSLEEFKANGNMGRDEEVEKASADKRDVFAENLPGWYDGSILFKRVIPIPETQKFQYVDTRFVARVKAHSKQECYNRILDHLRTRQDVDPRSQFPSIKGRNFECVYRGMTLK